MVKHWRALTVLTAESVQTKAMTHLDLDDYNHHEDTNRQAEKVISNQIIHPFKYEEQEMVNISTGHNAKSAEPGEGPWNRNGDGPGYSKRNRQ